MIHIDANNELKMFRGEDFIVSKHIKIHQPTLAEICDYGEEEYYSMIYQLTATPQSMKAQLWDIGIDYTTLTPYQLFINILYKLYPQKSTAILFGDLDIPHFKIMQSHDNKSIILHQTIACNNSFDDVVIDESTYFTIADYLRGLHFIEKDERIPANQSTKMALIEDAIDECLKNRNKEYPSQLKNLISFLVNNEGFKYNHSQVWDMKIYSFMDSVKRIIKTKNVDLLLQSGYSGYGINLKDIDKKQINYIGEL